MSPVNIGDLDIESFVELIRNCIRSELNQRERVSAALGKGLERDSLWSLKDLVRSAVREELLKDSYRTTRALIQASAPFETFKVLVHSLDRLFHKKQSSD